MTTEPAGPEPAPDPQSSDPLAEAIARGDHFARVLAAIVATHGPVRVSMAAYRTVDPSALFTVLTDPGSDTSDVFYTTADQVNALMSGFGATLHTIANTAGGSGA